VTSLPCNPVTDRAILKTEPSLSASDMIELSQLIAFGEERSSMAIPRITHGQRERVVLADLEANFPNFTGHARLWTEVSEGQDAGLYQP
jgi:hypothetical protein